MRLVVQLLVAVLVGAAVGLYLLGLEESRQALERAASSVFPGIRRAVRRAKEFV